MLTTESRPRDLRWVHAGPLLYGDWGTSRLYVLGLAFLYTAHASIIYLAAIGLLMLAVSWAYTHICRCFPDGGGVYTAARRLSPTLSVVGSTLLLSGYIMTAAISVIEAFHYFHVPERWVLPCAVGSIVVLGGVNWLGAKSAGKFALVVALAALVVSGVMAVVAFPAFITGIETISFDYFRESSAGDAWVNFTRICLALAGVEAVANMTGLMKEPVEKEAKRTIWPVSGEVVGLNLFFGLALAGLGFTVLGTPLRDAHIPDEQRLIETRSEFIGALPEADRAAFDPGARIELGERELAALPDPAREAYARVDEHQDGVGRYTNAAMRVVAESSAGDLIGPRAGAVMGHVAGITFGLLLLSATNTAIMAMVSVFYAMAQDKELPGQLTRLNFSGVPWVGLIISVLIPIGVILVEQDVTVLASLYVLGVTGAITVTVLSTSVNRGLELSTPTRVFMVALGLFLLAITLTIGVTQPVSTAFSGSLVALTLGTRTIRALRPPAGARALEAPDAGWLAILRATDATVDPDKPKIMLAARGRSQSEFAVDLAKRREATLFAIFVRPVRVLDLQPGRSPRIETDEDAQQTLGTTAMIAREHGVPIVPIYVTAQDIAEEILDYTATYNCDTLIMGKSRRSSVARRLEGDVVSQVARHIPDGVMLLTRSAETPHAVMPVGTGGDAEG